MDDHRPAAGTAPTPMPPHAQFHPEPQPISPARATPAGGRALAPDVARGLMLLAIVLANTTVFLYGRTPGLLLRPVEAGPVDRVVDAFGALVVDHRAFPMFAFLFAYGIHQLTVREQARGASWPATRALLVRRNLWLLTIGVAHAVLLFFGDIVTSYALCGLVLVLLVRAPRWALWVTFGLSASMLVAMTAADVLPALAVPGLEAGLAFAADPDPLSGYLGQVTSGALGVLGAPLTAGALLAPMVLGLLAARMRLLEAPWAHARLVRVVAFGGVALGLLGGAPFAWAFLAGAQPDWSWLAWGLLHGLTGLAAGPAYACAIALVVARAERRRLTDPAAVPGPVARALAALGRRSLSGYVAQSVCFLALFPAWTLGLGGALGTGPTALVAVGIWLLTLAGAAALERLGRPGPLEWLLRRLTYGRGAGTAAPARAATAQ